MATIKGLMYSVLGFGGLGYAAMVCFFPEQKKIENLKGLDKADQRKLSPGDIIRLSATSDKPLYRLSKKELDEVIRNAKED